MSNLYKNIGNPVDMWWNSTRQEIALCIDLLAQFSTVSNSSLADELTASVGRAYHYVTQAPYPAQASQIRDFLLETLLYLHQAIKAQEVLGINGKQESYNIAKHKFTMVSFKLLKRGIYEPTLSEKSRVA